MGERSRNRALRLSLLLVMKQSGQAWTKDQYQKFYKLERSTVYRDFVDLELMEQQFKRLMEETNGATKKSRRNTRPRKSSVLPL